MAAENAHVQRNMLSIHLSRGYTCDFLLERVMLFFEKLLRGQRAVKIARVATHEHATRQLKKMAEKSRKS